MKQKPMVEVAMNVAGFNLLCVILKVVQWIVKGIGIHGVRVVKLVEVVFKLETI
jgi:hypothetical protein